MWSRFWLNCFPKTNFWRPAGHKLHPGSDWSRNQKWSSEGLVAMRPSPGSDRRLLQKSSLEGFLAMTPSRLETTPEPLHPQLLVVAGFDSAQAVCCGTRAAEYLAWVEISPKSSATNLCPTWSRTPWMSHIPQTGSAPQDPSTFLQRCLWQCDEACFVPSLVAVIRHHTQSHSCNHATWCIPKPVDPAIRNPFSPSINTKTASLYHPQFAYPNSLLQVQA